MEFKKMIVGSDWIWLHFPKCGGTSAERMLRLNYTSDNSVKFDKLESSNVLWHDTIPQRRARDLDFSIEGKRVVAIFRRLPEWLLSRVHFEASRPPYRRTTREMILNGEFYENSGFVNTCDKTLANFSNPRIDFWIRLEKMHEDFEEFFGRKLLPLERKLNENKIAYIKDLDFWFTEHELADLYRKNPMWTALERRVYGELPISID